jgi:hypothetical protein
MSHLKYFISTPFFHITPGRSLGNEDSRLFRKGQIRPDSVPGSAQNRTLDSGDLSASSQMPFPLPRSESAISAPIANAWPSTPA